MLAPAPIQIFLLTGIYLTIVDAGINERHLINHLLNNYNPLERPVPNENETLNVIFGLTLQQIIDVDEKNQMLISNLWLKFQWVDVNLQWNPEDYGGIENLRITTDRIWIPDVLMYNSADERFDSTFRTNVIVNHTGGCLYVPPGVFKSTCRMDITWFPFDDQECELKFGSWTYDGLQVDLLQENISADTSPYLPNGEWVLVDVPSVRTSQYYECCPGPFVDVKFKIQIKRRTLYYGFNLIIPCFILSSMTLLSFSLPPESGEKLHLGVTILLSMTVFLVQLSKILPATSDSISIMALYFGSIMVMVAVSVVMTVVVLNLHHRSSETKEMGPKLRKFLLDWLPRVLGMERPGIKPPKQCLIKKASSRQKLVSALGCASGGAGEKSDKTVTSTPNTDEDVLSVLIHGNIVCNHKPVGVGNAPRQPSSQQSPAITNNSGALIQMEHHQDGGGATLHQFCPSHRHLFASKEAATDAMLMANGQNPVDGLVDDDDEDGDEEVAVCSEVDVDEAELDSVTLDGGAAGIHCGKKTKQREKGGCPGQGTGHQDPEHHARHQYMGLRRRHKLLEILIEMRFVTDRLRQEDQIKDLIAEWRYGAIVLDRLCLILFTIFTILSLAICLISAPQLIV